MDIRCTITPELEAELLSRAPWVHPYRLADDVIVGWFKGRVDDATVCTSSSPQELIGRMKAAYADHLEADPLWEIREFARAVGSDATFLDIACATGLYTLALALEGAHCVVGVEIRREQVEQANLIVSLDDRFSRARFDHEPVSADQSSFRLGETYDGVMSLGLLYHLRDPVQHLDNLRRLGRKACLLQTLTHAGERGTWMFGRENPANLTHAIEGVSWIPHFADVPDLLRKAGFETVHVIAPPRIAALQEWDTRQERELARMLLPGAVTALWRRRASRRYLEYAERNSRGRLSPRYYAYLAT